MLSGREMSYYNNEYTDLSGRMVNTSPGYIFVQIKRPVCF